MPVFHSSLVLARPRQDVFDFFIRPANLLKVSPPEFHMRLEEGPDQLHAGARIVLRGRRMGVPQRVVSEVVTFEPVDLFIDKQREGPFRKFVHTHRFEVVAEGTLVTDRIEFEPPGGMLGLVVTANIIERELKWVFEHRHRELLKLLGDPMPR